MTDHAVTDDAVTDDAVTDDAVGPDTEPTPEARRALFRVVRGTPTDEELAALTVVLLAAATPADAVPPPERSAWTDRADRMRRPLPAGPGAWRASAWLR